MAIATTKTITILTNDPNTYLENLPDKQYDKDKKELSFTVYESKSGQYRLVHDDVDVIVLSEVSKNSTTRSIYPIEEFGTEKAVWLRIAELYLSVDEDLVQSGGSTTSSSSSSSTSTTV